MKLIFFLFLNLFFSTPNKNNTFPIKHYENWLQNLQFEFLQTIIGYFRIFLSQNIAKYGSSKTFFFNWENFIFFVILKLNISIQHPKYKNPYLKYENWHQDLQFEPLYLDLSRTFRSRDMALQNLLAFSYRLNFFWKL